MTAPDSVSCCSWFFLMVSCCWLARAQYDKSLGRIEKWVMRKAFDDEERPYLPKVKMGPPVSEL